MCKFFSVVSDGKGKIMYFDWELREKCIKGDLSYEPDSHTSIADYFGYKGLKEDVLNKYEYNPLTKKFQVDQLNTKDDSKKVEKFCKKLDFKTIVPQLIIKPIIHPFKKRAKVTDKDIQLLKKWDSVRAPVWASVRDSVWASVWDSVWASVWDSVGDSVGASVRVSVRDSVWASVGASVGDSVGALVWASVWDSVRAYASSFFNLSKWEHIDHKEGVNPFQCCIDLWEKGLVPSFDGKEWRIHSGAKARVVYKISKENIKNV
jgi:hypothetical protein